MRALTGSYKALPWQARADGGRRRTEKQGPLREEPGTRLRG